MINKSQNKTGMISLPLMMNNTFANPMNYIYPKIYFNKLCFPQNQPIYVQVHKKSLGKFINSSCFLSEIIIKNVFSLQIMKKN